MSDVVDSGKGLYRHLEQKSSAKEDLEVGDHVWHHVVRYGKLIQHHGIWVGCGVIHFDGEHEDEYHVYDGCAVCTARTEQQRRDGTSSRCIRLSCFLCFSHKRHVYRCEYDRGLVSHLVRETGSRSTRISYPEHVVASVAWGFYLGNNFGDCNVVSHNCEDFDRWCKVRKVGSKQVTRGLTVLAGTVSATASFVGWGYN